MGSGPLDGLDWSPLELSGNPVPGDPAGVRRLSGHLTSLANDVGLQNRLLRSVGSSSESMWEGPAASKFHPTIQGLPAQLDNLVTSYHTAAGALEEYWPKLHSAQTLALEALHEARLAQADIKTAQGNVSSAQTQVNSTSQTYNLAVAAEKPTPGAPPVSPHAAAKAKANTTNAKNAYSQSQTSLANAQASLTSANGRLSAAKSKAATARSNGSNASAALTGKIKSAGKAAPAKPHHHWWQSAWDDVTSTVSGGFHWVEHHASAIETVALTVTLGPAGMALTSEGRKWLEDAGNATLHGVEFVGHEIKEGCKAALPVLDVASGVLGLVSLGLAVVGFVPGVGEVADVLNEGVTGLKTGVDTARLIGGEEGAAEDVEMDGLALVTGGESRLFTGAGDIAKAGEELTEATKTAETIETSAKVLRSGENTFNKAADAVGSEAERTEIGAKLTSGVTRDLDRLSGSLSAKASALRGTESTLRQGADAFGQAATHQEAALTKAQESVTKATKEVKEAAGGNGIKQLAGTRPLQQLTSKGLGKTLSESGVNKASDLVKPSTYTKYYKNLFSGAQTPYRVASTALGVNEVKNGISEAGKNFHRAIGQGPELAEAGG